MLREKAAPVEAFDESLRELVRDLLDTVELAGGVGLAAPQIGVLERVMVVWPVPAGEEERRIEDALVLVNPEVADSMGPAVSMEEGCLSIPGIYETVKRPAGIRVHAKNSSGEPLEIEDHETVSRILQHEIDHLDGVLFIDLVGPMKRALLKKRLRELAES